MRGPDITEIFGLGTPGKPVYSCIFGPKNWVKIVSITPQKQGFFGPQNISFLSVNNDVYESQKKSRLGPGAGRPAGAKTSIFLKISGVLMISSTSRGPRADPRKTVIFGGKILMF